MALEAWSAYKPVVATSSGGPRDFVTPNTDGFLVDPNAGSIAWGCCEILKNFEHARWMGERGRVKAAFNFSWDHVAKTTEKVYYEQLNKHDSPDCEGGLGGCGLAHRLMGPSMHDHMGVFDPVSVWMALGKGFCVVVDSLCERCWDLLGLKACGRSTTISLFFLVYRGASTPSPQIFSSPQQE